jgi:hypothetical protein
MSVEQTRRTSATRCGHNARIACRDGPERSRDAPGANQVRSGGGKTQRHQARQAGRDDDEPRGVSPETQGHLAAIKGGPVRSQHCEDHWKGRFKSAAMWSVYGHAGIAVGSTIGALRASLPGEIAFQIARIFYNDHRPSAGNHLNPEKPDHLPYVHRPHLIKGREYEHEHEIRVVTRCYPDEAGRLVRNIAFGTLIRRLIISPVLPYQEALAIERFLKSRDWQGSRPEISRSSLLPDDVGDGLMDSLDQAFDSELDAAESALGVPQQLRTL